jgi:hypothetical protein
MFVSSINVPRHFHIGAEYDFTRHIGMLRGKKGRVCRIPTKLSLEVFICQASASAVIRGMPRCSTPPGPVYHVVVNSQHPFSLTLAILRLRWLLNISINTNIVGSMYLHPVWGGELGVHHTCANPIREVQCHHRLTPLSRFPCSICLNIRSTMCTNLSGSMVLEEIIIRGGDVPNLDNTVFKVLILMVGQYQWWEQHEIYNAWKRVQTTFGSIMSIASLACNYKKARKSINAP